MGNMQLRKGNSNELFSRRKFDICEISTLWFEKGDASTNLGYLTSSKYSHSKPRLQRGEVISKFTFEFSAFSTFVRPDSSSKPLPSWKLQTPLISFWGCSTNSILVLQNV